MVILKIHSDKEVSFGDIKQKVPIFEEKKLRKDKSANLNDIVNYLIDFYKKRLKQKSERKIPETCEFSLNKKSYFVKFGLISASKKNGISSQDIEAMGIFVCSLRKLKTKTLAKLLYAQLLNKEKIEPDKYDISIY